MGLSLSFHGVRRVPKIFNFTLKSEQKSCCRCNFLVKSKWCRIFFAGPSSFSPLAAAFSRRRIWELQVSRGRQRVGRVRRSIALFSHWFSFAPSDMHPMSILFVNQNLHGESTLLLTRSRRQPTRGGSSVRKPNSMVHAFPIDTRWVDKNARRIRRQAVPRRTYVAARSGWRFWRPVDVWPE